MVLKIVTAMATKIGATTALTDAITAPIGGTTVVTAVTAAGIGDQTTVIVTTSLAGTIMTISAAIRKVMAPLSPRREEDADETSKNL